MSYWRESDKSELSARKLAARLWQSQFKDVPGNNGAGFEDRSSHLSKYEVYLSHHLLLERLVA